MAEARGFCKQCNQKVLIRNRDTQHIMHFLITIFTLGLWMIIWALDWITPKPYRCTHCGKKTRKSFWG